MSAAVDVSLHPAVWLRFTNSESFKMSALQDLESKKEVERIVGEPLAGASNDVVNLNYVHTLGRCPN